MNQFLTFILLILLTGCSSSYYSLVDYNDITCLSLVDRDGFTTTVQTKDRLQQYAGVDFLTPQAYQKVMCIYRRDQNGNVPAFVTSYYENGQISQYLDLVNSRAFGSYQEWYENGKLKLSAQVVGGDGDLSEAAAKTWVFDGPCEAWDKLGNLEATIYYDKGSLEQESLYYHPSGQIQKRVPYHLGEICGRAEIYDQSNKVIETADYEAGLLHGPSQRFFDDGALAAEEHFERGRLITARYYNRLGEIVAHIDKGYGFQARVEGDRVLQLFEYRNGRPEGIVKTYDDHGRLNNVLHIKDGKKHGEEIVYYTAPVGVSILQPKLSIVWNADRVHGIVRTWYSNGTMESQREMANNKRNGLATAWYRNGNVMLMEEYDHDRLVKGEYFKRGERRAESKVADGTGTATLYDSDGNLAQKVHYYHGHVLD